MVTGTWQAIGDWLFPHFLPSPSKKPPSHINVFLYYQEDFSRALVQSQFGISLKQVSNVSLEAHVVCSFMATHVGKSINLHLKNAQFVLFYFLFSILPVRDFGVIWRVHMSWHLLNMIWTCQNIFEMCYFGSAFVLEASEDYKYILRFF